MSSYMVADKTINRFVSWVMECNTHNYIRRGIAEGLDIAVLHPKFAEIIGSQMHALNVRAVDERYEQGAAERDFGPLHYAYRYELCTMMQAYKSLRCWHYQCSEGTVTESPLYKLLDQVSGWIANQIISDLPDYEKAEWG